MKAFTKYFTIQMCAALMMFGAFYCIIAMLACVIHRKTEGKKDGATIKSETQIRVLKPDKPEEKK